MCACATIEYNSDYCNQPFPNSNRYQSFHAGESFLCHVSICPVKNRNGELAMVIMDFDDPNQRIIQEQEAAAKNAAAGNKCE